ncbi:hypothetical protein QBC43DRAFT_273442 [Cladorrhinum sp. PSN259]|nr:hypothetical protein QBC43DRAFT_273442 [Cladorrhinum sp. PSN259]
MADASVVAYNIATFIATLFLLEFGADKFIDHTAVIARRTGLSETIIGLVTAGGEWEELAVIIASLARGRSSLAIGNIIGAAVSNILGAFSLGLLFYEKGKEIQFDKSARIYSLILLVLTTFVVPITYFPARIIWLVCGSILIAIFVIYLLVVGVAIARGLLTAPEDSDSDSDSDSSSDGGGDLDARSMAEMPNPVLNDAHNNTPCGLDHAPAASNLEPVVAGDEDKNIECASAGLSRAMTAARPEQARPRRSRHGLSYHCGFLLLGLLAICLAGYVLSQAATNITDQFGISDVLFGVIILAIATTLPEKFMAVMSGHRGHPGILVANCAGSNVFLLTLCVGIIMVDTKGTLDGGNVTIPELVVLWVSTLGLTLTVWFGAKFSRWIGAIMLAGYIAFIVLEFVVIHRVVD